MQFERDKIEIITDIYKFKIDWIQSTHLLSKLLNKKTTKNFKCTLP